MDDTSVALAAIRDVVGELRDDLDDGEAWLDHDEGRELVERLEAILRDV